MSNFRLYIKHGFGWRKSFRYAFGITVRDFIWNLVWSALMVLALGFVGYQLTDALIAYGEICAM